MRLFVLSDPHFAGPAERARHGWEQRAIPRSSLRALASAYRRWIWLADPTAHNHQLEAFIDRATAADLVVANGDYSCDSAFIGVADEAARDSARACLDRLRVAFGDRFRATLGDHELGKMSLFGGRGGPRVESWSRCHLDLGLEPFWRLDIGTAYCLVGVTSTLLALPVFEREILESERATWTNLRTDYLRSLGRLWESIPDGRRVLLFCHDPTALPFLARQPEVARRLHLVERTIIGHLHSEAVLRLGRLLAGMPEISFLGRTVHRLSGALRRARAWHPFRPLLCPSLAGIQLLRDGGYLEITLDPIGNRPPVILRQRLPWHPLARVNRPPPMPDDRASRNPTPRSAGD